MLTERWRLEARWEAFNAINHVNYNNPTTALNSANFGRILGAADPRIMQVSMKIHFYPLPMIPAAVSGSPLTAVLRSQEFQFRQRSVTDRLRFGNLLRPTGERAATKRRTMRLQAASVRAAHAFSCRRNDCRGLRGCRRSV